MDVAVVTVMVATPKRGRVAYLRYLNSVQVGT